MKIDLPRLASESKIFAIIMNNPSHFPGAGDAR